MAQLDQVLFALMMTSMQKFCIPRCITRPGDALSHTEKECFAGCQDKFKEAYELAFQECANRAAEQHKRSQDINR